jgi:hypothetical protein
MTDIPDGWTDDMTIRLPDGVTVERIVDMVLSSAAQGVPHETRVAELVSCGLAQADAELACDRTLGGALRAATRNPDNAPSQVKDPIASASYLRCQNDMTVVAAIFPQYLAESQSNDPERRHPWWKIWK